MVCKYLSIPFTFFCYTDDRTGIDPAINIIPFVDNQVDGVWNKLFLFSEGFGNLEGKCLFFDLDIVLMNNIDHILHQRADSDLCVIKSEWTHPSNEYNYNIVQSYILDEAAVRSNWIKQRHPVRTNSSMIMWEPSKTSYIWDYFMTNPEYFMMEYLGIDRFIVHEGIEHDTFPSEDIYSYFHGADYRTPYAPGVYRNKCMCLFNIAKETPLEQERFHKALKQFKEYWS